MTMLEWAKKEIELACKKENPNWDGESFDYGCSCYQSALKAFESLCNDDHSGYSFSVTKNILIRLMNHLPLRPSTDEDFKVTEDTIHEQPAYLKERGLKSDIQCPRMSSLFRQEYLDGTICYEDISRSQGVNVDTYCTYGGGGINKYVNKFFPITMPYYPSINKFKVFTEDFLLDIKNGDYDHKAYLYMITPEGERIEINEYFKEVDNKWVQISKEEYEQNKNKINEEE